MNPPTHISFANSKYWIGSSDNLHFLAVECNFPASPFPCSSLISIKCWPWGMGDPEEWHEGGGSALGRGNQWKLSNQLYQYQSDQSLFPSELQRINILIGGGALSPPQKKGRGKEPTCLFTQAAFFHYAGFSQLPPLPCRPWPGPASPSQLCEGAGLRI